MRSATALRGRIRIRAKEWSDQLSERVEHVGQTRTQGFSPSASPMADISCIQVACCQDASHDASNSKIFAYLAFHAATRYLDLNVSYT